MATTINMNLEVLGNEFPVTVSFEYDSEKQGREGAINILSIAYRGQNITGSISFGAMATVLNACARHVAAVKSPLFRVEPANMKRGLVYA